MVMEFNLAGLSEDELIALNLNNFAKLATLFDGISVLLQSLFKEAGLSMTTYLKKVQNCKVVFVYDRDIVKQYNHNLIKSV